jgi:hypothetical protein
MTVTIGTHTPFYNILYQSIRVYQNDVAVDSHISIPMYPVFNIFGEGVTEILLPDFHSDSLGNTRPVTVHRPYSLLENPLRRPVNVLVVFDGDIDTITLLSRNAGMDGMISTGQMPETIIVGQCTCTSTHHTIWILIM